MFEKKHLQSVYTFRVSFHPDNITYSHSNHVKRGRLNVFSALRLHLIERHCIRFFF